MPFPSNNSPVNLLQVDGNDTLDEDDSFDITNLSESHIKLDSLQ